MSATKKSIAYLVLAFGISWGIGIGAYYSGLKDTIGLVGTLAATMVGPAIAALICAFAFEKGNRVQALGLGGRWSLWWFAAWIIPILLVAGAVAFTLLLGDRTYTDIGQAVLAASGSTQEIPPEAEMFVSTPFIVGVAISFAALINWPILTFTEELGWRGYLHHLWRPAGFWRASLATGFVWALWHIPAIALYGLNYPGQPVLGIGLFVVWCMLLSPIMTHIRDRTNSVWSAGLFHGTLNAIGALSLAAISDPAFPWNGIVGIGGFVALAIGVAIIALVRMGGDPTNPAAAEPQPASA